MFERFDKSGTGIKTFGQEKAGPPIRTETKPHGSDQSYPGKGAPMNDTYKSDAESGSEFEAQAGGTGKTESYSKSGSGITVMPGMKAPYTLPPPRQSKPKEL